MNKRADKNKKKKEKIINDRIIITIEDPKSPIAEAYRTLRTNIQFTNIDKTMKSIVITSPNPLEGKSTVAVNLAVTIANNDNKVLLIDCDLRKPRVHKFFELKNRAGLTTVLAKNRDYKANIQSTGIKKLDLLASGPIPPNPAELLGSKKVKVLLEELKEDYDIVILDSPPVGLVTDAAILSTLADGVILVCAVEETIIEEAKEAKSLLDKVKANILGVVMNKIPLSKGSYYKYYYDDEANNEVVRNKKREKSNV